jgi:DNA-binding transcriptional regulator YbjK
MGHSFTRQELYNLVWSEPMRDIAARYQISDVGLAKACRNASIPVPPRGYWNKKNAGHKVAQFPLPPREPGHHGTVSIGRESLPRYPPDPIDENEPDPPMPTFDEPLEQVRARVEKRTETVRVRRDFGIAHPAIRKLLEKDEQLRAKQHQFGWYEPVFDKPIERRRLRILNAILTALAKQGFHSSIRGGKADEISVHIGSMPIGLELVVFAEKVAPRSTSSPKQDRLRLGLKPNHFGSAPKMLAEDQPDLLLEDQLREIVVNLIMIGEEQYRESRVLLHKWELERRQRLIERAREERAQAERKERERVSALEKARVDRLLNEVKALQRARDIRQYVEEVKALSVTLDPPVSNEALAGWERWALAQADRIDPVRSRRFLDNDELKPASDPSKA